MAYGIDDAVNELYLFARQPPYGLNVHVVADAARKCGMDLPKFLLALKAARAPMTQYLEPGKDVAMAVWKAVVNLSKSSATTAEFTEAVTAAMGGGGFLAVPPAAMILGAIGWGLIGGVVVVGGIGAYYYATTGTPIQAGWQQLVSHVRNVVSPPQSGRGSDPYGVFVGGGYNEVIVGQLSVIMAAPSNSLIGWGLDRKPVRDTGARFTMVLGPFKTAEQARNAYEASKVPGSQYTKPLAAGTAARFSFDGKPHDIDNALRLLR